MALVQLVTGSLEDEPTPVLPHAVGITEDSAGRHDLDLGMFFEYDPPLVNTARGRDPPRCRLPLSCERRLAMWS